MKLSSIFNSSTRGPITVGVVSFGVGVVVGMGAHYILTRQKVEVVVHEEPEHIVFDSGELEDLVRSHGADTFQKPPEIEVVSDVPPEDLGAEFVHKKMEEPVIIVPEPPVVVDEPVLKSVFAGSDDEWDYDTELATRSEAEPHIIHVDEFYENETEYSQSTLTYYVGDDILADAQDSPVYNFHGIVGTMKFGHGSGDPNVVYIRNDKRKAEYEIFKHDGLFSVEVMGLSIEDNARVKDLKHSHHVPRFIIKE